MSANRLKIFWLLLIFVVLLGFGIGRAGIAEVFSDPVSGIRAQDETTYASSATGMAVHGGWSTPTVLGRYYLVKPPLLIWLAGFSMRLFGISLWALRLPVLLAGACATLLLFLWSEKLHSRWAAAVTVALLLSNPLWHTFSRITYTDMLLAAAMTLALLALVRDPDLSQRKTILVFGCSLAAGLMAKNVAGLLPLLILLVSCLLARKRPPFAALLKACALAALLVAPWHLYQIISHPRWFWTDYVGIQLLQFGFKPPAQPSPDGPVWFYLKRLVLTDPLLCGLALLAAPFLIRPLRQKQPEAVLLISWILVTGAALLAFRYRNLPYLLYTIPPLCLLAAGYGPLATPQRQKLVLCLAVAAFCVKAAFAGQVWGLPFGAATPIPSEKWLQHYSQLQRPNELIAVNSDDEFYATVLPLPKVRYCYIDPTGVVRRYAPHYAYLGITVSASQFENLPQWEPQFREHLHQWGLNSMEPIATNIVADSAADVAAIVETHPQSDFYIPSEMLKGLQPAVRAARRVVQLSPDRAFLLAADSPETGARLHLTGKLLLLE